jgi:PhoH-like ATPase
MSKKSTKKRVQLSKQTVKSRNASSDKRKTFVIDTNVFLQDASALFAFEDNDVVIPMVVLEEIDRKKDRFDSVGSNARQFCRDLDDLRELGSLSLGVQLPNGGRLRVKSADDFRGVLPEELDANTPDNMIMAVAIGLRDSEENSIVKIVTKDINLRIKCNVLGIDCEDYVKYRVAADTEDIYTGVQHIQLPIGFYNTLTAAESDNRCGYILPEDNFHHLLRPNEYVIDGDKVFKVDNDDINKLWKFSQSNEPPVFGLKARNLEQKLALKLLLDDRIKLVTLVGAAGTGKTLLAVAVALETVIEQGKYTKLIITRPVQPVGKDIGYLPGTKDEKMDPWVQPIYDNVECLININSKQQKNRDIFDMWREKNIIEIEAITYIRGRSLSNAFIIIDEAQNLTVHELKTIVTRVGDNTKIVLTGDIDQIDNNLIDPLSNGLTYAVEKFKDYSIAGHMTLKQGERSELATLAAKIL